MPSRNSEPLLNDEEIPQAPLKPHTPIASPFLSQPSTPRVLHRQVWQIALPAVVTMLLQTVNGLMDMFFVGHLATGSEALAATGIGGSVIFLMISLAMGVAAGTMALVSRFTGAQEPDNSRYAMGQSITLATLVGAVMGVILYFGRDGLCAILLNSKSDTIAPALCSQFLGMAITATIPIFLINVLQSAFRGVGDTRTPLLITSVMICLHILCNWLFIYGNLGFPRMEVQGAGLAFALSQFLGMALFFFALVRLAPLGDVLKKQYLILSKEWVVRILRIGVPASVQNLVRVFSMMTFTGMLARMPEGSAAVAALQIGIRTEALAFMPGFAYSVAASALVGQSLGAKLPDRAERYAWAANLQAVAVMSLVAILFYAFASPIVALFTFDVVVHRLGVDYLHINAFCEPFLGTAMVLSGALQGAGDTIRPTYITIFTMVILRTSVANILMFRLQLHTHGAWLTMATTTIAGGLLTLLWFRMGRWKSIKV